MDQPEEFQVQGQENRMCKLNRSFYGLKQAQGCWNVTLDERMKEMGFAQTISDPCLYIARERELFLIGLYINDILLAGKSENMGAGAGPAGTAAAAPMLRPKL